MYSINVNVVTSAQRGVKLLKARGINASIGRIKNSKKYKGCGYTVNVSNSDLEYVINLFKSSGIEILGVDEA